MSKINLSYYCKLENPQNQCVDLENLRCSVCPYSEIVDQENEF